MAEAVVSCAVRKRLDLGTTRGSFGLKTLGSVPGSILEGSMLDLDKVDLLDLECLLQEAWAVGLAKALLYPSQRLRDGRGPDRRQLSKLEL